MQLRDYTVSQEQIDKITVWACTTPSFTLGHLKGVVSLKRVPSDHVDNVARNLMRGWKNNGKIKYARGRWSWQA